MQQLSAFFGLMLAISIAVERCVEILKGVFPWLATASGSAKTEGHRSASVQFVAVVFGTVIAEFSKSQLKTAFPGLGSAFDGSALENLAACVLVGFMASGGSGLWNHLLDLVGAMKVKQEQSADAAKLETKKLAMAAGSN